MSQQLGSTTQGLPVAPSMAPALEAIKAPHQAEALQRRTLVICGLSVALAAAAAVAAQALTFLISLITNLAFFQRVSVAEGSPAHHTLGIHVLWVPVLGALVVGVMARYGSKAIRGHGIPEAMEQVLFNQSRIPARLMFLKPASAAVSIGTGGPFGAEGPIIATGGALGSVLGQVLQTSAEERKVLLAAGAGAGMAATFGSPVSAVLLAVELLLFEYRPRSLIPVALATTTAAAVRLAIVGGGPVFAMPDLPHPGAWALGFYLLVGAISGVASVLVTRIVYFIEDAFERLPIHWMWWPALGAVAVGVVGYFAPRTLGVGYDNIQGVLTGELAGSAVLFLCLLKFVSWSISLGSGTSGGTLAPLFTVGGGLGAWLGSIAILVAPGLGIDARMAALVGMAAMFAGASRALLASIVFAFETTREASGLLPLLGGCSVSFLISALMMRNSIMTEKIARRGSPVPSEYAADALAQVVVGRVATKEVVVLLANDTLVARREWLASGAPGSHHEGYPVVDEQGLLIGVVSARDLLDPSRPGDLKVHDILRRPPAVVFAESSLRDAVDHMAREGVGRLPVVGREAPRKVIGILSRKDVLKAHGTKLIEAHQPQPGLLKRPSLT
jgi:H+/Cl- antiporter ClcA/CBS domain-containing protein